MKDYILYILLICIYHSILLFNKSLGLNSLLFIVPLLILIFIVLKNNKKIVNKKGLLLFIPIILLSAGYLIYYNSFFNNLNMIVIPLLFILMLIFTTNKKVNAVIIEVFKVIFEPFNNIGNSYRLLNMKLDKLIHLEPETKKKIKSILIVIPIVIIVIYILSTADIVFSNLFKGITEAIKNISIGSLIGRAIRILLLFTYIGAVLNYIVYKYKANEEVKEKKKLNSYTFKVLFTSLNIVYVVFDIIQIKSLYLHNISMDIPYAEYARTGFFQLMFISLLNLIIILLSKKSEKNNYNKLMAIVMIFLTFIIILSSTYRMYMYETAYGYTLLRLLVYLTLFTEVILLIPTILHIFHDINIWKHYFVITLIIYTCASLAPVNYIIAKRNIGRFEADGKIDIKYLENESPDNIPLLLNVYGKLNEEDKTSLRIYINRVKHRFYVKDFRDYNLSKNYASKKLKDFKFDDVEES